MSISSEDQRSKSPINRQFIKKRHWWSFLYIDGFTSHCKYWTFERKPCDELRLWNIDKAIPWEKVTNYIRRLNELVMISIYIRNRQLRCVPDYESRPYITSARCIESNSCAITNGSQFYICWANFFRAANYCL